MKDVDPLHDTALSYQYEPDLDPEIIEGRLLMTVFLYTHKTPLHTVTTNIHQLLSFCHMKYGITHWKGSAGIRILQKGLDWLSENGYVVFIYEGDECLEQRRYRDVIEWRVDPSLFDMSLENKCFDPFIQMYERDVTALFKSDVPHLEKVLRVYCYIRACLKSKSPFVSMVSARDIVDGTGYSAGYVSKVTRFLCDELGVLHRVALNRTSEQYPPYMYIANIPNWEQYLNEESAAFNDNRGGIPIKQQAAPTPAPAPPPEPPTPPPVLEEPPDSVDPPPKSPFISDGDPILVLSQDITNPDDLMTAFKYVWMNGLTLELSDYKREKLTAEINANMNSLASGFGIDPARLDDKVKEQIKNVVLARRNLGIN